MSHAACSKPADSDPHYTLDCEEPDSEARYLIDAETGTDQPFTAKMAAAFELLITDKYNAYGSVYATSGNIEYSRAK